MFILLDEFIMSFSQRRSGPMNVGYYGLTAPFINAFSLIQYWLWRDYRIVHNDNISNRFTRCSNVINMEFYCYMSSVNILYIYGIRTYIDSIISCLLYYLFDHKFNR